MTALMISNVLFVSAGAALWKLFLKDGVSYAQRGSSRPICIICVIAVGAAVYLTTAMYVYGLNFDISCWLDWSRKLYEHGLKAFYTSEGLHDYPPGYVYVLYILGAIRKIFGINGIMLQVFIKLPAIIASLVSGIAVYGIARKRYSDVVSAVFAAVLLFNPAYIVDGPLWGQVDSIHTLFCMLAVYFTSEKRYTLSYFIFAVAVLIKPQSLFFTPVLIYGIIEFIMSEEFERGKLIRMLLSGIGAVAFLFAAFMPFGKDPMDGIAVVIGQYIDTLSSSPYMSMNAFNVYAAIGKNQIVLNTAANIAGYGAIPVIVAYSAYVFFKCGSKARYYLSSFVLVFGMFMLAVKMHERYAFPAVIFLLLTFITAPDLKSWIMYVTVSLSIYFNIAFVLFIHSTDPSYYVRSTWVTAASAVNIAISVLPVLIIQKRFLSAKKTENITLDRCQHDKY